MPPIATVAPAWKLEPLRVTATLVPWVPLLGAIELSTGTAGGAVTVTVAVPMAEGDTVLAAWMRDGSAGGRNRGSGVEPLQC